MHAATMYVSGIQSISHNCNLQAYRLHEPLPTSDAPAPAYKKTQANLRLVPQNVLIL